MVSLFIKCLLVIIKWCFFSFIDHHMLFGQVRLWPTKVHMKLKISSYDNSSCLWTQFPCFCKCSGPRWWWDWCDYVPKHCQKDTSQTYKNNSSQPQIQLQYNCNCCGPIWRRSQHGNVCQIMGRSGHRTNLYLSQFTNWQKQKHKCQSTDNIAYHFLLEISCLLNIYSKITLFPINILWNKCYIKLILFFFLFQN